MKRIIPLLVLFSFIGCSPKLYTHKSYFDCEPPNTFEIKTDRQKIIYHLLEKAVVSEKDIPDYGLHKNKTRFYVLDKELISLNKAPHWEYKPIDNAEKPMRIQNVEFCWKSKEVLQEIANKTDDFLYLALQDIQIQGNKATVKINNNWLTSAKNRGKYIHMSGGGYMLQLIKEDNEWILDPDGKTAIWMS